LETEAIINIIKDYANKHVEKEVGGEEAKEAKER